MEKERYPVLEGDGSAKKQENGRRTDYLSFCISRAGHKNPEHVGANPFPNVIGDGAAYIPSL